MEDAQQLRERLRRIDGRGYKAYRGIKGEYRFARYILFIDHVQGDPFAVPSRVRVRVDRQTSGFGPEITAGPSRTVATCDFLIRQFSNACLKYAKGRRGTGKSGLIAIDRPAQEILARTALVMNDRYVEARCVVGLPARGRRISAADAVAMFFEELPRIVETSLHHGRLDDTQLRRHILTAEDADSLRCKLNRENLVGFVADGALLPRATGIDSRPMEGGGGVPFESPGSLRITFDLPNRGKISGMGIPEGVTLIVGGGYHGKSTLLDALELGVYNHVPGDGREFVVSHPSTVKIRAADGRSIVQTDISPFIGRLPLGKETVRFSTVDASGSTSQAASIVEAIEAGASVLLLDEDTSATNFMIRDRRMQQLVSKDREPITPFIDKVKQLHRDRGVSTVLVMGGSGDYFSVADQVIQMVEYQPFDVTREARRIADADTVRRLPEGGDRFGRCTERIPLSDSFNPFRGRDRLKISAARTDELVFGNTRIDLGDVEQIVGLSQVRGVGHAIHYATRHMDGRATLKQVIDAVFLDIREKGLDCLTPYITGDLAYFRETELSAAINRMRTLRVRQKHEDRKTEA